MDIQVALAHEFLSAIVRLPRTQQKKVNQFVSKFRNDPHSPGINYEKINDAANPDMRSVRIDQAYRGIILKPNSSNVYILLWVDHHDDAYKWARRHQCKIHPSTGIIQLYASEVSEKITTHIQNNFDDTHEKKLLFENFSTEQLLSLGLPEEFIDKVRGIKSKEELEILGSQLPNDAFESLSFLAEGIDYDEVFEIYRTDNEQIDIEDFEAALKREGTKRLFVIADDEVLQQMLDAPLEKWRVFLHPSQRKLVERDWNGPVRVLGGAGTGKTVAAIHRAKWLASTSKNVKNNKILFTTFTKNLASDITQHLSQICSNDELSAIETLNIDAWVNKFLKRNSYSYDIVFPNDSNPKRVNAWSRALDCKSSELDLSEHFYEEEWKLVIQEQGITDKSEYIRAKRTGRGTRLNRKERFLVWSVFEEYLLQLSNNRIKEMPDAMRDCIAIIDKKNIRPMYSSVIVDEGQDMGTQAYKLIRRLVAEDKNDIFIVGDGHQRIYRNKVVLSHCGVNILGRSRKLRVNYRTTEETKKLAVSVLENIAVDDLDNGRDDAKGYISLMHGENPEIVVTDSFSEESDSVIQRIKQLQAVGTKLSDICLVARTKSIRDLFSSNLKKVGMEVYEVLANGVENRDREGVRVATMHRVKGLEFQYVFIVGASSNNIPLQNFRSSDPVEIRENELSERALLHVAMTRAKRGLTISCNGSLSSFIKYN